MIYEEDSVYLSSRMWAQLQLFHRLFATNECKERNSISNEFIPLT